MGEMRLNSLQPLHTRPLQTFKVIEDLTTTLHQDIQRQYQYCWIMYGNTVCVDQAMRSCIQEMNDLVGEYEKNVPYHTCGERGIKLWAGTGDRVKQAVLWSELEKADKESAGLPGASQRTTPRALYKRVVTQLQEEIIWCEEGFLRYLTPSGIRFNSMPSPRSLAEELDATDLDEDDKELAESWYGGKRLTNGKEAEVDHIIASEETCGSSTETFERKNDLKPSPESVDQYDDDDEDESGVLLPNDPSAGRGYTGAMSGTRVDRGDYSGVDYDCISSPERCCCRPPSIVYL